MSIKNQIIVIVADTNDADYVTEETIVKSQSQIDLVKKFAKLIKSFKPYKGIAFGQTHLEHDHNFPHGNGEFYPRKDLGEKTVQELYGDKLTQAELDKFLEMVPFGENGIHTIKSIKIVKVVEKVL